MCLPPCRSPTPPAALVGVQQAYASGLEAELCGLYEHGFSPGLLWGFVVQSEDRLARYGRHLGLFSRPEAFVSATVLDAASSICIGLARSHKIYSEAFRLGGK